MFRKGGDFFTIFSVIAAAVLGLTAVYWTASIGFAVVAAVFAVVSGVGAKLFRWPMRRIAIPLATRLHIGDSVTAALLGILLTAICVFAAVSVIQEFNASAVRRIGQGIHRLYEQSGRIGEFAEQVVAEGVGNQRLSRWTDWVWEQDMSRDDTADFLAKPDNRLPGALFDFSDLVNEWGRRLMHIVYEGEDHQWFLYAYWLVAGVVLPMMLAAFLITTFQLSVHRLIGSGLLAAIVMALLTLGLVYCLIAACYLVPFVSHPYHSFAPFWIALLSYVVAGAMCMSLVRANQQVLFRSDEPEKKTVVNPLRAVKPRKA